MKSPDLVQPDIVAEECIEEIESDQQDIKSPDHIHLLPIEKTRRRVRLRHSESNDYNFDPVFGEGSVYTSPSLFSLVSIPEKDEDNKVYQRLLLVENNVMLSIYACRMYLMLYQRRRELMEQNLLHILTARSKCCRDSVFCCCFSFH